jgi:hypothetical protein
MVRYRQRFILGTFVQSRILLCGVMVGTFILALAFLSRRDGLWRREAAPVTPTAPQARISNPPGPPSEAVTARAAAAAPAATAAPAAGVIAPPDPAQSEPHSDADAENEATPAQRDRGTERSSRSR